MSKPWSDPNSNPAADLAEMMDKIKADAELPMRPNPVVTWAERPIVSDPDRCWAQGTTDLYEPGVPAHVFRPDNPTGLPVCIHCHGRKF